MIFNGTVSDIDSRDRTTINIRLADKLQKLNFPLTSNKLGTYGTWSGTQTNQDAILPLVFGEVFNVAPLLANPAQLEYVVSDSTINSLIEVRDNGIPVSASTTKVYDQVNYVSTGYFKPAVTPAGAITCSVQGDARNIDLTTGALNTAVKTTINDTETTTYKNTVAHIIALIVTQYGPNKFTAAELDLPLLNGFATEVPHPVGIYVTDNSTVLTVCQELASSIGAQVYVNRLGKLQLLRIFEPGTYTPATLPASSVTAITDSDIIHHSFHVVNRVPYKSAVTIRYAKNWNVQSNLVTAIYPEDKSSMATEYLTKTYPPLGGNSFYLEPGTSDYVKDTLLLKGTDAQLEANRLGSLHGIQRTIYGFKGTSKCLGLVLGQLVNITHNRFGLSSGANGQVVSISPDWLNGQVSVEVLI
jgi:hypothetical protein